LPNLKLSQADSQLRVDRRQFNAYSSLGKRGVKITKRFVYLVSKHQR